MLNYRYVSNQADLDLVLGWLNGRRYVVLDTETTGVDPLHAKLVTIQLGDADQQWVIDTRTVNIAPLCKPIEDPKLIKLGQNLKFDWQMLHVAKNWYMRNVWDTMLAEQVLRCGLHVGCGLDDLMLRYYQQPIQKDDALRQGLGTTQPQHFSSAQLEYMAGDCVYPLMVAKKQRPELKLRGLESTLALEHEFLPVLAKMELQGMTLNTDQWVVAYQQALTGLQEAERQLDQWFGTQPVQQENLFAAAELVRAINYSSSHQIRQVITRRGYTIADTNEKTLVLAAINGELPADLVEALLQYRMCFTRITRYGLNFLQAIDPTTQRLHTVFGQAWTNTGRLTSGQSSADTYKVNFQNIPTDTAYRGCIQPRPGYCFLIYDYQAIEPRILGDLSKDPTYLEAFANDRDIYGHVGERIYGEPVNKTTARGLELRDKTKVVVLGNAYGTGKPKFHRKLLIDFNLTPDGRLKQPVQYITRQESDTLWERFFEICPRIKRTLDYLSAIADPVVSNRRVYDSVAASDPYDDVYKKCYEHLIQRRSPQESDALARKLASNRAYVTYSEALGGRKRYYRVSHRTAWTEGRDYPMQACLPADTRILTPDGWLPIGQFTSGTVWTGNNWASAVRLDKGPAPRLRLHLSDGRIFDCDNRHYLLGFNGGAWPEWIHVNDILGKELIRDHETNWGKETKDIEDWYWLGRMIGDGYFHKIGWKLAFGPKEHSDVERFLKFLSGKNFKKYSNSKGYNVGYRIAKNGDSYINEVYGFTKNGRDFWSDLGLVIGKKAGLKRIPEEVFTLDFNRRKAVFDGYFDADGHAGRRSRKITSINYALLQDTLQLMQTIGLHGRISAPMRKAGLKWANYAWYDLRIHSEYTPLCVTSITELPEEDMFTLSVDDEKHSFSSEGLISKNTAATIIKQGMVDCVKAIREHGHDAEFVNQIHDEVMIECRIDQAEAVADYVKPLLEAAGNKYLTCVKCKAEGGIRTQWTK